jgi:hypothetical protein
MNTTSNIAGRTTSLHGDGMSDIFARNYYTGALLYFGHQGSLNGPDTYTPPVVVREDFGPRSVEWFGVGDFTGDGRADIVVLSPDAGCRLYRNTRGLDSFATDAETVGLSCDLSGSAYHSKVVADIDGDGRADIVGRRAFQGQVETLVNEYADGVFRISHARPVATLRKTDYLVGLADVRLAGSLDLVVSRAGGELAVYALDPDGSGAGRWYPVLDVPGGMRLVAVSDVCGKGRADVLCVRADGALVAFPHSGEFRPESPLATFLEPVVVGRGWDEFDLIN